MPRQGKGAHLRFVDEHRDAAGRIVTKASWIIQDGRYQRRTGCCHEDRKGAELKLADYLSEKHVVPRDGSRDPSSIPVADVINLYLQDIAPELATSKQVAQRALMLLAWWGDKTLFQVNGQSCRDYVKHRIKTAPRKITPQAVRRDLEDLRSAINYHRKEGLCDRVVEVTLPERSPPKEEFLTRSQAAKLLWTAWKMKEVQKRTHDGAKSDDKRETKKRTGKHIARFILVGLYTGTRHDAVLGASFKEEEGKGWIDMEKGIFNRLRIGKKKTKKLQTPVRLPDRLMVHLRRWQRLGISKEAIVEWQGKPIKSVKTGFASAVRKAELGKHVTPHTLRHTAATWLMDEGHKVWDAAGYLGMSTQVLESTYAKHHPDYQIGMLDAFKSPSFRKAKAKSG